MQSPAALTEAMERLRQAGWVRCDWRARLCSGPSSGDEIDDYLEELGLASLGGEEGPHPLRGGWCELPRALARQRLEEGLLIDLAYGIAAGASEGETAPALVDHFLGRFGAGARLYTNRDERAATDASTATGWLPKTRRTFDFGVVAVDEGQIGMLWFADED